MNKTYDVRDYFSIRSELDRKYMLIECMFDAHKLLGELIKELKNGRVSTGSINPDKLVYSTDSIGESLGDSASASSGEVNQKRGPGRPPGPRKP